MRRQLKQQNFNIRVDRDFMLRLITYASHTYRQCKVLPIVLIIVTKSFSSANFQREFAISTNGFLLEVSCKFWAKKCVLLTADVVSNHLNQETLDPLVILGNFFTYHDIQQIPLHYKQNPTLALVTSIINGLFSKDKDMLYKTSTKYCTL